MALGVEDKITRADVWKRYRKLDRPDRGGYSLKSSFDAGVKAKIMMRRGTALS